MGGKHTGGLLSKGVFEHAFVRRRQQVAISGQLKHVIQITKHLRPALKLIVTITTTELYKNENF